MQATMSDVVMLLQHGGPGRADHVRNLDCLDHLVYHLNHPWIPSRVVGSGATVKVVRLLVFMWRR
jgi:hypothetical protein